MKTRNALFALAIGLFTAQTFTAQAQTNYKAGANAGTKLTTGQHNTFVGKDAGYYTTTGNYNSFYGSYAGSTNVSGNENSFFGSKAGIMNSASYNSFFGYQAGRSNTSGQSNSFFGHSAGDKNKTGVANVFVGNKAGFSNTTGNHNVFLGHEAGNNNTTGGSNVFMGSMAGRSTTTGINNTFLGNVAGFNTTTAIHNTFVGGGSGLKTNTGNRNTFLGADAGWSITSGNDNIFIGYRAGYTSFAAGLNNSAIGAHANAGGWTNATAIGWRAYVSTSNSLVLGSINGVNGANASTNVGIGTHAPAYRLHVNGDAAKPGSSAWTVASDKRLKQDVKDFEDGLAVLRQIRPVTYKYNGKAGMPKGNEYIGVIAQEVEAVAPYMIHTFAYADSTGAKEEYLDFDATALPYIIINAIKDQQQAIEEKDAQVQTLVNELKALRQELEEIRKELPGKKDGAKTNAASLPGGKGDANWPFRKASLSQNAPNPFGGSTTIRYQIPTEYRQAYISVHNLTGAEVHRFNVTGQAGGEVTLGAGALNNGAYVYQLWVDGQLADSKKMILSR